MSSKRTKNESFKSNKKRKANSLQCELYIINDFEAKIKICELAKKFDLPESTGRTVIKGKEKIMSAVKDSQSLNSTIIRKRYGIIAQ